MQRCFDLARLGGSRVSSNPMVGAVIVADGRIIGEGFHQAYGAPHAEVNAVNSIKPEDKKLLTKSTIYVSLEPCCIHGKTPPCTNLILENKIPRVVISALDKSPDVNGKSLDILRNAGVEVIENVLSDKGEQLSQPRSTYVCDQKPYVILKFAQSKDGFMAGADKTPVWISNLYTKRLTHKWRNEINAILVGTNTAAIDNPSLTNRYFHGDSPVRVVLDKNLELKDHLDLFDNNYRTIVFTEQQKQDRELIQYRTISFDENLAANVLRELHRLKISILLIEGGAATLNTFIQANLWDEARIITGNKFLGNGIKAPEIGREPTRQLNISSDELAIYYNK